jgi:hypothetical protein
LKDDSKNAHANQDTDKNGGLVDSKESVQYNIAAVGMDSPVSFAQFSESNTDPSGQLASDEHSMGRMTYQEEQDPKLSSRPPYATDSRPSSRQTHRRNSDVIKPARKDILNRSGSEQSIAGSNPSVGVSSNPNGASHITLARSGSLSSIHQMFDLPSSTARSQGQAGGRNFQEPLFPAGSFRSGGGGGGSKSSPWK